MYRTNIPHYFHQFSYGCTPSSNSNGFSGSHYFPFPYPEPWRTTQCKSPDWDSELPSYIEEIPNSPVAPILKKENNFQEWDPSTSDCTTNKKISCDKATQTSDPVGDSIELQKSEVVEELNGTGLIPGENLPRRSNRIAWKSAKMAEKEKMEKEADREKKEKLLKRGLICKRENCYCTT